jgi:hypothetical protein
MGILLAAAGQESGTEEAQKPPPTDPRLQAIGGGAAGSTYFAYLVIGMSGDAFRNDVYDAGRINQIMNEVKGAVKNFKKLLENLKDIDLTEKDKESLKGFVEVQDMLSDYCDCLVAYTKTKGKKEADAFQEARKKTWAKIKVLLGIK